MSITCIYIHSMGGISYACTHNIHSYMEWMDLQAVFVLPVNQLTGKTVLLLN